MAKDKTNNNWRKKIAGFWKGTKPAAKRFAAWFRDEVAPECMEFLEANKDVAMRIVLQVAKDMVGASNGAKRKEAFRRIDDHLMKEIPNFKAPEHWLSLLLEIAVTVLKGMGKI